MTVLKNFLVIGVKWEKLLSVGKRIRRIKLGFGGGGKEGEVYKLSGFLSILNGITKPELEIFKKIQEWKRGRPM